MRVTGGRLRGRKLRVPSGSKVRPSSDRVREALFGRLGALEGVEVLDLYAGTGALGIEALSRGAAAALFVERSGVVLTVLRGNLDRLGLGPLARVARGDAPAVVRRLAEGGQRFDLVLLDSPYAAGEAPRALRALATSGILKSDAMVVVESARHHPLAAVEGFERIDERRYGDTVVTLLALAAAPGASRSGAEGGSVEA